MKKQINTIAFYLALAIFSLWVTAPEDLDADINPIAVAQQR